VLLGCLAREHQHLRPRQPEHPPQVRIQRRQVTQRLGIHHLNAACHRAHPVRVNAHPGRHCRACHRHNAQQLAPSHFIKLRLVRLPACADGQPPASIENLI